MILNIIDGPSCRPQTSLGDITNLPLYRTRTRSLKRDIGFRLLSISLLFTIILWSFLFIFLFWPQIVGVFNSNENTSKGTLAIWTNKSNRLSRTQYFKHLFTREIHNLRVRRKKKQRYNRFP